MIIVRDFKYWKATTPSKSGFSVLLNPNFYALLNYRIGHFFSKKNVNIISKILWLQSRIFFSIDIDWRAQIGEKFMIIHGVGLVIGAYTTIENGCKIYQGCTIGGNGKTRNIDGREVVQPIIKEDCVIYASATIIGPVIIGKNTKIGSGTIVQKDVPENSIVYQKKELTIRSAGKENENSHN